MSIIDGTILSLIDNDGLNAPIGSIAVVDSKDPRKYDIKEDGFVWVRWLWGPDLPGVFGQNDGYYKPETFAILQEGTGASIHQRY